MSRPTRDRPAKRYHLATSYDRRKMGGHFLDWTTQPGVFKKYPGRPVIPLPQDIAPTQAGLAQALTGRAARPDQDQAGFDLSRLSRLLYLAYGVTAQAKGGGSHFLFRSPASAGALYPCELYLAAAGLAGLKDGLYHYAVAEHALQLIQPGPIDPTAGPAANQDESPAAGLTLYITAIFFRSAWKYRDRAYRYSLLDSGHLAENLALALASEGLAEGADFELVYDFDDAATNRQLVVDDGREVCLALARVFSPGERLAPGPTGATLTGPAGAPPAEDLAAASIVSPGEVTYPTIQDIHRAGQALPPESGAAVMNPAALGLTAGPWAPLPAGEACPEKMDLARAVTGRRSKRNYIPAELPADCFGALSRLLCAAGPEETGLPQALQLGCLVQNTAGLADGFYLIDRDRAALSLVAQGGFQADMAAACLNQDWLRNAALHWLCLVNLDRLEDAFGPRGYRHALLTAGRLGQRIYLGATALGLGACGIGAFYDDEAAALLGLNAASRLVYLIAAGPIKK